MRLVKCSMVAFVIFFVLMALPGFAEYYQYRDENGVLIFTDDFSNLPMEQRPQVKVIKEINDGSVDSFPKSSVEPASQDETRVPQDVLMQEANELSRENEKLKREYASIKKEKDKLLSLRQKLTLKNNISQSELANFEKQVSELNLRTKAYDAQLKAHRERSKAYNQKIDQIRSKADGGDNDRK